MKPLCMCVYVLEWRSWSLVGARRAPTNLFGCVSIQRVRVISLEIESGSSVLRNKRCHSKSSSALPFWGFRQRQHQAIRFLINVICLIAPLSANCESVPESGHCKMASGSNERASLCYHYHAISALFSTSRNRNSIKYVRGFVRIEQSPLQSSRCFACINCTQSILSRVFIRLAMCENTKLEDRFEFRTKLRNTIMQHSIWLPDDQTAIIDLPPALVIVSLLMAWLSLIGGF